MYFQNPYSRPDYKKFFQDSLLTDDFRIIEEEISFEFKPQFIKKAELIGRDKSLELEVYEVQHESENDPRVGLSKDFFRLMANYGSKRALAIFYSPKSKNYRLSLATVDLSLEGSKVKREYSNPRRYSFFLGPDAKVHTPYDFLIKKGRVKDFEDLKNRFSIEVVTKQFYNEIANWYFWALDKVEFPDDEDKNRENRNAKNLIRLITRIIFIWFMKEKNLIPSTLFDKSFVEQIINYSDKTCSTYYKAILQNLFFATLNTKMKKDDPNSRIFIDEAEKNGYVSDAYLEQGYYRYSRFLKNKGLFLEQFEMVPFLNGGLFESLDKKIDGKEIRIDCFSDNPKNETRLKIPDELFFLETEKEVDLSKYLDKGSKRKVTGLLTVLKRYNFTIDENTPIDQDIALDPELLGKVFENLLAAYVPETATTARKSTGSYYTPREIVDYMVDESLITYLKAKMIESDKTLSNSEDKLIAELRKLLSYDDNEVEFTDKEKEILINAIENLKVIDPACGSGAFPMGILHKLVLALHKLDPQNEIWKKRLLDRVPAEIRAETEISLQNKSIDYIRKLGLIENCIYGIDIQEIAIQISKLRFFISLLVEQEIDDSKPNRDIRALPNLETKFVAANTLIGLERPAQMKLVGDEVENLEKELFDVREEIFYTNSRKEKIELQKREKQLRKKLKIALQQSGFQNDVAEKISGWDPFDQNTHSDWFDNEWMFGLKSGFDIVIGNPPYIQLQKDGGKLAKLYQNQNYITFARTGDIYTLFYEKGIYLLKEKGTLCYITSNKWMRAGYGEKLRQFFLRYNPLLLIDLGPGVFENATVDTNILIIQKAKNQAQLLAVTYNDKNLSITETVEQQSVRLEKLTKDAWFIGSSAEQKLKEKIENIGKPLKDWDVKIYRGVLTGLNEAFIITTEKRNEILENCKDKEERKRTDAIIKPILRGRDIKRYYYEWDGLWVIVIPAGWTEENRGKEKAEKFIENTFPSLMKHLKQFEEKAKKRDDQGDYWWELRHCAYYSEFEKEKMVYSEIVRQPQFYFDTEKFYVEATSFLMTGKNVKYICGLLNSEPVTYFFKQWYAGGGLGEEGYRYKKAFLENLPLPPITRSNQSIVTQIEALVDKILSAKKSNPQADTSNWEREIDLMVYKLYNLTYEEVEIIDPQIGSIISKEDYEKFRIK